MGCDACAPVVAGSPDELREAAKRRVALGRAAWPQLPLAFDAFEHYFAQHATLEALPREQYAADMYLAWSCAYGIGGALVAFEDTLAAAAARAVASVDSSQAFVDESLQATCEKLLVRQSSEPSKIAEYAGRASLRSWLCAIAVRSAISARRRKGASGRSSLRRRERFRTSDPHRVKVTTGVTGRD
jgi:RNA polymerase sigma-70 factor, ECF subfamily